MKLFNVCELELHRLLAERNGNASALWTDRDRADGDKHDSAPWHYHQTPQRRPLQRLSTAAFCLLYCHLLSKVRYQLFHLFL